MNGEGVEMDDDGKEKEKEKAKGKCSEAEEVVLIWGYLPGVSLQRSPLLCPVVVRMPESAEGDSWRDVCGGGCGFAMAISESGKLLTWGSTDDMGQSYVASGKHEGTPEPFLLPTEAAIVKAAAGWAHCVAVTAYGEVYTWGWKECVPSGKVITDQPKGGTMEKDDSHNVFLNDQVSPRLQASITSSEMVSSCDSRGSEESTKRRRVSSAKQGAESSASGDETFSAPPCLVTFSSGVRIAAVAAGGRHTLALSGFRCRSGMGLGLWWGRAAWFGFSYQDGVFSSSCALHCVSFLW